MNIKPVLCLTALGLLLPILTGCKGEPPPSLSSVPIHALDWEGETIDSLCLIVEENDPLNDKATTSVWSEKRRYNASNEWLTDGFSQLHADRVKWLLEQLGIEVVESSGVSTCDTTLRIILGAHGLIGEYFQFGSCWTGAQLYGRMVLEAPGKPMLISEFADQREVSGVTYRGANCSPHAGWVGLTQLLDQLASWWGPEVYIEALRFPSGTGPWFHKEIHVRAARALGFLSLTQDQRTRIQYYLDHSTEKLLKRSLTSCGSRFVCGPIEESDALAKLTTEESNMASSDLSRCWEIDAFAKDMNAFPRKAEGCVSLLLAAAATGESAHKHIPGLISLIKQGTRDMDKDGDEYEREVALLAAYALPRISGEDYLLDVISWEEWWRRNESAFSKSEEEPN
jgi:hypothetical protein